MGNAGSWDHPDGNRMVIVQALRAAGVTVDLLPGGKGRPDLMCGRKGVNYLLEVKRPKGKLRPEQIQWHTTWLGQVCVVRCVADALRAVGLLA